MINADQQVSATYGSQKNARVEQRKKGWCAWRTMAFESVPADAAAISADEVAEGFAGGQSRAGHRLHR